MKQAGKWILIMGLMSLVMSCERGSQQEDSPNILVIIADDLTHFDIGCYGSPNVQTPNIDALASQGLRFTRCFQAAPMCSPTRHNFYTGLYPVRNGAYPNHAKARPGTKSIAHYLDGLGYRVGLTGKKHIAPPESFPFDYMTDTRDPDHEALEDFITRDRDQPFCAFVCYREPHTPWNLGDPSRFDPATIEVPPYLVDTDETRKRLTEYYAEIEHLDQSVGHVMDLLDKHNLSDNTLLLFASEQGNAFPFAKWTCYDMGLQSALIARWPGHITAGSTTDAMVEYVDMVPTFIDLAQGAAIDTLDGQSFLPVLLGEARAHKQYVYGLQTTRGINNGSEHYGIRSVRGERFRYIVNLTPDARFQNNITEQSASWTSYWPTWQERAKTDSTAAALVARYHNRPAEELYDIVQDPFQQHNLATKEEHEEVVASHRRLLFDWMEQQGDRGQETEMEALDHKAR